MKFVQENCGIFGMWSTEDCAREVYQGIDFLQHRGQQYCGIATFEDKIRQVTHYGKVANTFNNEELSYLRGAWGIGHVSLWERQPVTWQSKLGEIAVAFSGNIINAPEILKSMKARGQAFYQGNNVEIIAKIILEEKDVPCGITSLARRAKGAYSLVVLAKNGIYATRDVFGFRPLILGRNKTSFVVSSESRALQNMDLKIVRDVRPGEIVLINKKGFTTVGELESPRRAHCAFEWAYTASIDSIIDGLYVQEARNNLGAALAQRDIDEGGLDADIVSPVPMSGIGHALGYHCRSGLPYQEVFLYNRYADRSYTQATQADRDRMAKKKLSVLRYAVEKKKIVICDDSIVRGTQIRNKVKDLKDAGAKAVHVRIACPPLMYPCDFGISTRTSEELAARRYIKRGNILSMKQLKEVEKWIAKEIDAESVKYNSVEGFVAALGIPRENLCLKCWDGLRPVNNLPKMKK